MMAGWLWDDFRMIMKCFWHVYGMFLWCLWDVFEMFLGCFGMNSDRKVTSKASMKGHLTLRDQHQASFRNRCVAVCPIPPRWQDTQRNPGDIPESFDWKNTTYSRLTFSSQSATFSTHVLFTDLYVILRTYNGPNVIDCNKSIGII